jgi:hypothetical protein
VRLKKQGTLVEDRVVHLGVALQRPRVCLDVTALKQCETVGIAGWDCGHPWGNPAHGFPRARVDGTYPG